MAGKNKKEIRSFEAQNVRFLRSSSLTRILRLLIKKFSVFANLKTDTLSKKSAIMIRCPQHYLLGLHSIQKKQKFMPMLYNYGLAFARRRTF